MEDQRISVSATERQEISDQLLKDFSFEQKGLDAPIQWTDNVGFSRVRKLQNGFASLFKVGIGDEQLKSDSARKSLWVTASYGEESMGGIKFGESRKISDPVDLDVRDEYFYEVGSGKYFRKEKEVTPEELLTAIEETHTKPSRPIGGFQLRNRHWFWRKFLPEVIKLIDLILIKLLFLISGEKIKDDIWRRLMGNKFEGVRERIPPKVPDYKESDKMDFFGYKAKRWSVVFYCTLHLSMFIGFWYYSVQQDLVAGVFQNNFSTLCYVVVSFAISEALMPNLLKRAISKTTPLVSSTVAFKRLKI